MTFTSCSNRNQPTGNRHQQRPTKKRSSNTKRCVGSMPIMRRQYYSALGLLLTTLMMMLMRSGQRNFTADAWMSTPGIGRTTNAMMHRIPSNVNRHATEMSNANAMMVSSSRPRTTRPFTNLHSTLKPETISPNSKENLMDNLSTLSEYQSYQNKKLDLQLLLLDNYDSYTYNIYSYLSTMCKKPPIVVSNDAYGSWDELIQAVGNVDGIVISPGPGRPERKEDMGVCLEAIEKNPTMPILGVCLGHQALGYHYNAKVELAPFGPVHGLTSKVVHDLFIEKEPNDSRENANVRKCNLFEGIPQSFDVVRYHSLTVQFPPSGEHEIDDSPIEPIAWCKSDTEAENGDGEICMALRHKINPHYGVQFHPESVGTGEYGYRIFQNFCQFSADRCESIKRTNGEVMDQDELISTNDVGEENIDTSGDDSKYKVLLHKISKTDQPLPSPEIVFENMFATMDDSFWLDSSTGRKDADLEEMKKPSAFGNDGGCPIVSNSRFSIMGGNLGPLCKKIEYWGKDHKIENRGLVITDPVEGTRECIESEQDIISFLHDEILTNGVADTVDEITFDALDPNAEHTEVTIESTPFQYRGGFVGYIGYEVWHDTRGAICRQEACGVSVNDKEANGSSNPLVPTSAFLFADRSLVYDHWRDDWYLVGVTESSDSTGKSKNEVIQWMRDVTAEVTVMSPAYEANGKSAIPSESKERIFNLKRSKDEYSADIARCHEEIRNGESYELCLTNQLSTSVSFPNASPTNLSSTPFGLYKILRHKNPAPFAAFLKFDSTNIEKSGGYQNDSSVSICCSSPERFLSVTKEDTPSDIGEEFDNSRYHGWEFAPPFVSRNGDAESKFIVESKPIKGTASRIIAKQGDPDYHAKLQEDKMAADELQKSMKNRAENLMIVDLLRNDLSRVCEPGSVHVPKLMGIESFATVHQMVSTIRGIVDSKYTPIDVIAACFPGGSMTGAPKLRSVDILDDLELGNSRGPYSGCLGYISLNGSMDMNIVIRTAVVTPGVDDEDGKSWEVTIGAGGAITALSESEDEFEEMLLKASAIKKSVQQWNHEGL